MRAQLQSLLLSIKINLIRKRGNHLLWLPSHFPYSPLNFIQFTNTQYSQQSRSRQCEKNHLISQQINRSNEGWRSSIQRKRGGRILIVIINKLIDFKMLWRLYICATSALRYFSNTSGHRYTSVNVAIVYG